MQDPRVLIVESNEALRVLLFTILRHQPLSVDTCNNCDQALEMVSACDYALIIVDVDLPNEDGVRFITTFREQRPEANSFILAVRDPKNDVFLDPSLVSAVLNKPLEIDTMAEVVRECAYVVPPPEDPRPCPPSESDIRTRMERGPYIANWQAAGGRRQAETPPAQPRAPPATCHSPPAASMINAIGWASSIILVVTIGHQVAKQWREKSSAGVSKWLFIGQLAASVGFTIYSLLLRNWVFAVTNGVMVLNGLLGYAITVHHKRRGSQR